MAISTSDSIQSPRQRAAEYPQSRKPVELHPHQRDGLILVSVLFAIVLGAAFTYSIHTDTQGRIPRDNRRTAAFGIDPNTAEWFEFALLPGIGETLSRRIVSAREDASAGMEAGRPVFALPGDLMRVRGIGGKTIQRISPFLRFPTQRDAR
ncbi:MAG: ComEA family DNA-binding protein [Phycisphaerae bacterium]